MAKRRRSTAVRAPEFTGRCATGICDPARKQGLKAPAAVGTHDLVVLEGPGLFVSAAISKQGGTNDLTFVILEIDGRNVTNLSFAAANNQGLTQHNPYGLVVLHSTVIKTVTVGFPTPLVYKRSLRLSVKVNEPSVVQILANVIHGSV